MTVDDRKYRVDDVGPRIDRFLTTIFKNAGLDLNHRIEEGENLHSGLENTEIVVKIGGRDVDLVLANKGEALLALEQLTMEMLRVPGDHHDRICFDANDYRLLRVEELRLSALAAADRVKRSRTPFQFSPMSSRERRIIHLSLREESEVRSESTGFGSHRQVVIYPADMPSGAMLPPPPAFQRGRGGRRR